MINPPRLRLILVDHNGTQQAIASLDEAELIEILDYHKLGNPSTQAPIRFTVDVVGSTSTLVSEKIGEVGLSAPPEIAVILLAGLISDTLILSSPTATERDHIAAERFSRWAFIAGTSLEHETLRSFGEKVLRAGTGLGTRDSEEIVTSDMKLYDEGGYKFVISQVEVSDLYEVTEHFEALTNTLSDLRERRGLNFAILMVTEVVRSSSCLLLNNLPPLLDDLPYAPLPNGTRMAEGVVSRKKQLLPVIAGLLRV